jgi:crossover junction endodeoxyribonuclease RuvC
MSRYRASSWRSYDPAALAVAQPARARVNVAQRVRILGLDPGSRRTGFGIIDCDGTNSAHRAHGCIDGVGSTFDQRVRAIFEGVRKVVEEHRPDEIAIERVFVNRNIDRALKLGQARGAALCALPSGVQVFEYAPRAIKLAVVGSGAAEKQQVAHMIRAMLLLRARVVSDASDALAVALCHAHARRLQVLIDGQRGGAR